MTPYMTYHSNYQLETHYKNSILIEPFHNDSGFVELNLIEFESDDSADFADFADAESDLVHKRLDLTFLIVSGSSMKLSFDYDVIKCEKQCFK